MKAWSITTNEIAETLDQNGPLWTLREEWCSQAFQQAHAIRAMLAAHRIRPNRRAVALGKEWAEMTLRLQGTHGHPDRYNMGYGFRLKAGIPENWYVADCGTLAVTLLDVHNLLKTNDPLRNQILQSVRRFADYIIATWPGPDGSFALGYLNFQARKGKPYHCAVAQSNLFLWPLAEVTGDRKYRQRAISTTQWLANWTEYDDLFCGGPIHNRAYNGESMLASLAHLGPSEAALKRAMISNLNQHIVGWALRNFSRRWFGNGQITHAKDPLLLMVLDLARPYLKQCQKLTTVIAKAFQILERKVEESWRAVKRSGTSGMAIANYTKPEAMKQRFFWPKYYCTDGLLAMALVSRTNPKALFPLGGP